ncbi:YncE family protein [Sedimentibacter sp. MB31-C6]|uniref:YncE family protein n=1 Tax=Sedimentibacter sp. MB31-C6 TaxID=3109366 RepID=UPI002DDD8A98|nr:hypothetical protein [Sedimentibacter sp. MB36-C1]WSI04291.1 hypothetical protein U8307_00510 [Sedimentibacter sp. MB36-C1]
MEKVVVTGFSQNRYLLMLLELSENNYICNKVIGFSTTEKIAVHSILSSGNIVYLADSFNNKIYKYNFDNYEFDETTVGRDPRHMCLNNENMFVTNFESDSISVIDLEDFTLTGSIPADIKPHDTICNGKINKLYTSCYEENKILEYDLSNGIKRYFYTEGKPMHLFLSEKNIIVMTYYVNGCLYTKINFINTDTGKMEKVIDIEGLISNFELDIRSDLLYLINIVEKSIYIIDVKKREIVKQIFLGGYPEGLTFTVDKILVTNSKKNQINIIDKETLTVLNNIDLNFIPECIKAIN